MTSPGPSFKTLRDDRFLRYWRYFEVVNIITATIETAGLLAFFTIVQRWTFWSSDDEVVMHLDATLITLMCAATIAAGIPFLLVELHGARTAITDELCPYLPAEFFDPQPATPRPSPSTQDRCQAFTKIQAAKVRFAKHAVMFHVGWVLAAKGLLPNHVTWGMTAVMAVTCALVATLYFLRLQGFDPKPLLACSWRSEPPTSYLHLLAVANQNTLHREALEETARSAAALHDRWVDALRGIFTYTILWARTLFLPLNSRGTSEEERNFASESAGRRINIHHVYLAAMLFVSTVMMFGSAVVMAFFSDRDITGVAAGIYILFLLVSVLALLLIDLARAMMRFATEDSPDEWETRSRVGFTLLSAEDAEIERFAVEGKIDPLTELPRRRSFELSLFRDIENA